MVALRTSPLDGRTLQSVLIVALLPEEVFPLVEDDGVGDHLGAELLDRDFVLAAEAEDVALGGQTGKESAASGTEVHVGVEGGGCGSRHGETS